MWFLCTTVLACTHLGYMDQCSDHGICAFDTSLNTTHCICTSPFTGDVCNVTATTATTTTIAIPSTTATTTTPTTTIDLPATVSLTTGMGTGTAPFLL